MVPPCSPVKLLIAADEFMYVTGIVVVATPIRSSSFQHDSTCCAVAISAIEQPAAKSGRITF